MIQQALYGVPWAITEQGMNLITGIVEAHLQGLRLTDEEKQIRAAAQTYGSGTSPDTQAAKVALLNLHGPIFSRAGSNMMLSGMTDPQQFAARLKAAADDPDIARIVISVDSPGGTVSGTRTAGDAVAYAASQKEVIAVCDDMACSAAYWIAAQATTVVADVGATVGSIGVIMSIKDTSAKNEADGVKLHVLRSGDKKALGQPGEVIDDKTLAHYQDQLMTFHDQFVQAVAAGRDMTPAQVALLATGDTWIGQQAVDVGLADYVGTLQQALGGEFSQAPASAAHGVAASSLRQNPAALSPAASAETPQGGPDMDPKILALLGVSADATPEQIEAAIQAYADKRTNALAANIYSALGVSAEDAHEDHLKALAARAKDGDTYRADLLGRLHALTISAEGNGEAGIAAADRLKNVFAAQSIDVITAEVQRLEAKQGTLPGGSLYQQGADKKKAEDERGRDKVRLSEFGLGSARAFRR